MGVFAEILCFQLPQRFFNVFVAQLSDSVSASDEHTLDASCSIFTLFYWSTFAQCLHAFSFGLFHLIAMRVIFQNFSAGQQGRGQALYSTMWG